MRLLGTILICTIAMFGARTWAQDASGGVTASVHASGSAGIGLGLGATRQTEAMATTDIVPSGTKAGELEKEAGKPAAGASLNEGPKLEAQFAHYFLSRWYDLIDIMDFSFGAGPGFMVNAHATKLAQALGGWSDAYHVGFRGRSAGVWRERRKEIGVSLLYYQKVERERVTGWVESFRTDKMDLDTAGLYANNNDRGFLGVGAMIQAGLMVNVNVRPMQAFDFVLGWLGVDVLDDDTGKPKRNKDL